MAKQIINLGTAPAGAGGDDRRSAWIKAKTNFTELYNWLTNTAQTDDQATALPAALPVARGGTGGTSATAARAGLGLGTAATATVGSDIGQVPTVGMYGIGAVEAVPASTINLFPGGFSKITPDTQYSAAIGINYGTILNVPYSLAENRSAQLFFGQLPSSTLKFRSGNLASDPIYTIYHTGNTTRAADGTLKGV